MTHPCQSSKDLQNKGYSPNVRAKDIQVKDQESKAKTQFTAGYKNN